MAACLWLHWSGTKKPDTGVQIKAAYLWLQSNGHNCTKTASRHWLQRLRRVCMGGGCLCWCLPLCRRGVRLCCCRLTLAPRQARTQAPQPARACSGMRDSFNDRDERCKAGFCRGVCNPVALTAAPRGTATDQPAEPARRRHWCTVQNLKTAEQLAPAASASSCSQKSMAQDAAAKATETIRQAPKPSTMLLPT